MTRKYSLAPAAVCLLAAVLYGWALWSEGWGNAYYTAAVKSMSESFENFLFGSFDPAGVVTVDKPPMALWPQVVATWVFGYHGWSVLLPQVVEGVAAVFLLHRTVRLWAGENAALVAALVLALTPITVAVNRSNNTDSLLVLLSVAAAYALTRAIKAEVAKSRTKWLLFAAFLLGCAFVTKMLAGWIVVPAFIAAYLAGTTGVSWKRRLGDLAAAAGVLLAASLWWVAVVDLWPGEKPYIGGSTDGSALDLILGYNGLGRVFGQGNGPGGGGGGMRAGPPAGVEVPYGAQLFGPGGGGFGGESGITRMFNQTVGGQISWLLPLALIVLVVAAVRGTGPMRSGWVLWGGWLLTNALVFSFQQGIFHEYYTTMLAPAIGALVGAGLVVLVRMYREPSGYGWVVLPASVAVTAAWAWVLVSRDTAWHGWVRYAVAAAGVVAVAGLVALRTRAVSRIAVVLGVVTLLLAPGAWASAAAFASNGNGGIPSAGPPGPGPGGGGGRGQRVRGTPPGGNQPGPGGQGGQDSGPQRVIVGGGGPGGREAGTLTDDQKRVLDHAKQHSGGAEIVMAVEGGSGAASPYIIATDETVVGMGGFSGQDPAPSVDQLTRWVRAGRLRFVLLGGGPGGPGGSPGGADGYADGRGGRGGPGTSSERTTWVQQNCKPALTVGSQVLYECTAG